jgi:cytochrome P450
MRLAPPPTDTQIDLDRVDLADSELYSDGEPHEVWRQMRSLDPVRWQPVTGRGGFWSVTRYKDAKQVMTDHTTFSSTGGVFLNLLGRSEPVSGIQFASTDPPRHGQIRRPIQRGMTGRAINRHREALQHGIAELFDVGPGPFDFARAVANLPMLIVGPLLGIPSVDWLKLSHFIGMSVAEEDPDYKLSEDPDATLAKAHRELFAYLFQLVRQHLRAPGHNLMDIMCAMTVEGQPMSAGAVVANAYSLLLGASAAIPHVPNAAVLELIRRDSYRAWAEHPELIPRGVEEALRWASPAQHFMRITTCPTRLGGVEIAPGEAIVVWLGSANRDEDVFRDPFQFDVRREPNPHLAFGAGHHYCIGSSIARLTLRLVFAELFRRFSDIKLAGEVQHVRSTWLAGIKQLPVVGIPR